MRGSVFKILNSSRNSHVAPALIGAGLFMLVAVNWWPKMPAVTGLSLIALGATVVTVGRFREAQTLVFAIVLHAAIYSGLYVLFVGAALHAATRNGSIIGFSTAIDLVVSLGPIGAALNLVANALSGTPTTE